MKSFLNIEFVETEKTILTLSALIICLACILSVTKDLIEDLMNRTL